MKVTVLKWTKTRTKGTKDGEAGKKVNRYQSQYFINVLEIIRSNLGLNVNSALALQDSWVLNLNNNFETVTNKLYVEFRQ